MTGFKLFLLNEGRAYLGHKVNDVLTSMQDLQNDMGDLGSRHLNRLAEQIVNEIRKILHSQWAPRNYKHLKELQKVAVAVQSTIEEKGDLREILPAAVQNLQSLAGRLGVKVNDLQAPEMPGGEEITQADFELTGSGPTEQPDQGQPPAPPMGQPPVPPMGQPPVPPMSQPPVPPMSQMPMSPTV